MEHTIEYEIIKIFAYIHEYINLDLIFIHFKTGVIDRGMLHEQCITLKQQVMDMLTYLVWWW